MAKIATLPRAPRRAHRSVDAPPEAEDPFSAAAGSVTHLLRGWATGMPVAVIAGPSHPPYYLYRDGARELIELDSASIFHSN